jgi:hypothetical protein
LEIILPLTRGFAIWRDRIWAELWIIDELLNNLPSDINTDYRHIAKPWPLYATFMTLTLKQLTKDIATVDLNDILYCWQWLLTDMKAVSTISVLGDIFLVGTDNAVYWLQTDSGHLTRTADTMLQFEEFLGDDEKIDNWFLPSLVEQLLAAGKNLKENEVYSYKKLPVIGGEYSIDNIEPTDMSVHFAVSGQICERIKDLPDGTKVNIKFE